MPPILPELPEGGLSLAKERLRLLLAACPRWQKLTGTDSAAKALESIYPDDLPPPKTQRDSESDSHSLDELARFRPFAIVETNRRSGYKLFCNAYDTSGENGRLAILIEQNVAKDVSLDTSRLLRQFENDLGILAQEMIVRRNTPGLLRIDEVTLENGPWRSAEDVLVSQGDFVFVVLSVSWGAGE